MIALAVAKKGLPNIIESFPSSPKFRITKSAGNRDGCMGDKVLDRHSDETIANNRLRLKTSINAIRWLAFQACAFRGDDESPGSLNRGNFIELIKLLASCNQNVNNVVLENAPGNAQYISPGVQKVILHIFARKVRATIREEIGDSKFCIIIDEARDESKREQMSVVLRFVDKHGCVQERFFDPIHISDTCSLTLKTEISSVLSRHNLDVQNLRGQGYDGASNMRGEWNGLQALFMKDCPFAYYIHCLAHRLQLALVFAAKEVCYVHQFFSKLTLIVNIVTISPKRHDQLRVAQANNIANLIANDQIVTGS
ncbi:zinc finger MYM-type protein 1-like [Arachis ipaensis]|uniref:zinc finger MYM-type protein 1-like n=1 Tax=Arachis ipaensis TaxID=130454 RepID=UPI000A2B6132|nr:zinc finger MYM-type protein 1-like [Arachis ipaensis]XP_025678712.1 zinc finger MYM-type protein 1-like [Arachis hypogaea]